MGHGESVAEVDVEERAGDDGHQQGRDAGGHEVGGHHERQADDAGEGGEPHVPAHVAWCEALCDETTAVDPDRAAHSHREREPRAELAGGHAVATDEERRRPARAAVAGEGVQRGAKRHVPERRARGEETKHLPERGRFGRLALLGEPAGRLLQREAHQGGDDEPRDADHEEGGPPAEELVEPATEEEAEENAEVDTHRVERQRAGAPLRRVDVGNDRVRRRAAAGLSHADADPGQEQLRVVLDEAAHRGHEAPDADGEGHDVAPIAGVGPARDRNAGGHVEERKGEAGEQTQLGVGQPEVRLDRLLQDRQQLTIDEVEGVDDRQQHQSVGAHGGLAVRIARVVHTVSDLFYGNCSGRWRGYTMPDGRERGGG